MWSTQIFIGVDMYLATATSVVDCLVFKKLLLLLLGLGTALPPSFWYGWSSLLLLGAGLSPSVWYGWFSLLLLCSALSPSVWYGWAVLLLLDTAILPSIWYGWSALLLLDTDLLPSVWYGLGSLLGGGDVVGGVAALHLCHFFWPGFYLKGGSSSWLVIWLRSLAMYGWF